MSHDEERVNGARPRNKSLLVIVSILWLGHNNGGQLLASPRLARGYLPNTRVNAPHFEAVRPSPSARAVTEVQGAFFEMSCQARVQIQERAKSAGGESKRKIRRNWVDEINEGARRCERPKSLQ